MDLADIQVSLSRIPRDEWQTFGADERLYRNREWWNIKFYPGGEGPGDVVRLTSQGGQEVPYDRRFGFPSKGRFAPPDSNVSWWARDHSVATCETDPNFRSNPPKDRGEYWERLKAGGEAEKEYGYPEPRYIYRESSFLDLSSADRAFFHSLVKRGIWDNAQELFEKLQTIDESIYPVTGAISVVAKENGLQGVIYPSARAPKGVGLKHVLACFNESLLELPKYPEGPIQG